VIATRARHPRASAAAAVASEFSRQGRPAEIAADVAQALALALKRAERGDLICATGSLFLVGEMIEYVRDLRPEPYPV
jgi:folylpolyglutamate synthase/dihydropteroate synthase